MPPDGVPLRASVPYASAYGVRYPVRSAKKHNSRSAVVRLIGDGITRPHLCLYRRFRLFNASLLIYAIRLARQVRSLRRELAPPIS